MLPQTNIREHTSTHSIYLAVMGNYRWINTSQKACRDEQQYGGALNQQRTYNSTISTICCFDVPGAVSVWGIFWSCLQVVSQSPSMIPVGQHAGCQKPVTFKIHNMRFIVYESSFFFVHVGKRAGGYFLNTLPKTWRQAGHTLIPVALRSHLSCPPCLF